MSGRSPPSGAWALVPVKPLARAKMRLSPLLSDDERRDLQRAMLEDVLAALTAAWRVAGFSVITRDSEAAAIAGRCGAAIIEEPAGSAGLNAAVAAGVDALRRASGGILAVIPADLPLAEAAEVDLAVTKALDDGATVVVPDRRSDGTNMLVIPAQAAPRFAFGHNSCRRHLDFALQAGTAAVALPLPSLALDIDTPDDLKALVSRRDLLAGRRTGEAVDRLTERIAALCVREFEL